MLSSSGDQRNSFGRRTSVDRLGAHFFFQIHTHVYLSLTTSNRRDSLHQTGHNKDILKTYQRNTNSVPKAYREHTRDVPRTYLPKGYKKDTKRTYQKDIPERYQKDTKEDIPNT